MVGRLLDPSCGIETLSPLEMCVLIKYIWGTLESVAGVWFALQRTCISPWEWLPASLIYFWYWLATHRYHQVSRPPIPAVICLCSAPLHVVTSICHLTTGCWERERSAEHTLSATHAKPAVQWSVDITNTTVQRTRVALLSGGKVQFQYRVCWGALAEVPAIRLGSHGSAPRGRTSH